MHCASCGSLNDHQSQFCFKCGKPLKPVTPPTGKNVPETEVEYVIPFKNMYGLVSYYIGIFSFIPFIGIIFGISAIILGVIGLMKAYKDPRIRGKIHSVVGILCGILFGLGQIFVLFMLYYARSMNSGM